MTFPRAKKAVTPAERAAIDKITTLFSPSQQPIGGTVAIGRVPIGGPSSLCLVARYAIWAISARFRVVTAVSTDTDGVPLRWRCSSGLEVDATARELCELRS